MAVTGPYRLTSPFASRTGVRVVGDVDAASVAVMPSPPGSTGQWGGRAVRPEKGICPLYNYFFSLSDSACLNGDVAVRTYPVREDEGQIVVDA